MVLEHQPFTLLVALITMVVTVWLYIVVPKGFFPVQDTGLIQGISVAAQTTSFSAMAQHQQELAAAILKDPDVVSVSSFIGVDGSNPTLNSGRLLINLKPKDDRELNATGIARRLQSETADVPGVSLYMQPVQDLTIDAAISRTQYQFVLENPNLSAFNEWVPKLLDRLKQLPELDNVASDLQQQGLTVNLVIDRETALLGITPATVDNARVRSVRPAHHLDDLFAVQSVPRDHGGGPGVAELARRPVGDPAAVRRFRHRPGPAQRHRQHPAEARPAADQPSWAAPGDDDFLRHHARLFTGRRRDGDPPGRTGHP